MKNKYPQIRFQNFSEEWLTTNLSSIVEDISGNDGRTDLPVLTISAARGWLTQEERFSQVIAGSELNNYTLLKKDDLSYNKGNSKTAEYGVVYRMNNHDLALVPKVYHSFRTTEKSDSLFIEKIFESKKPDRELMKIVTSGARMDGLLNINKKNFYSINVTYPSLEEQTKIGEFFKELDELIELQQITVDNLEEMKKGFLQNMFPVDKEVNPSIRYNMFSTDWYKIMFSDVFAYRNGKAHERFIENEGEYIVVNSRFVSTDGVVKKYTNNPLERLYEDEIAFVLSDVPNGRALSKAYLISENNKYTLNQRVAAFTPKDNLNPMFGYLLVNRNRYFLKFDNGVSQTNLSGPDIKRFSAYISTKNEQVEIGRFFKEIDELIGLEQRELESLQEMKKGFLQKMFV